MAYNVMEVGTRVCKDMGIRECGVVIHAIARAQYTDGQYRSPERHEHPVYVRWDNGTAGWTHREFLKAVSK